MQCIVMMKRYLRVQLIRTSKRKVREEVYETIANLKGLGLSTAEACQSIVILGKSLFLTKWKVNCKEKNNPDDDTLPSKSCIREAMEMVEAKSLSCIVNEIEDKSAEGRMITHATDSTTEKRVGKFAVSGIHVGQNVYHAL